VNPWNISDPVYSVNLAIIRNITVFHTFPTTKLQLNFYDQMPLY